MTEWAELDRLTAALPEAPLGDAALLQETGRQLDLEWPADYARVISRHNGVEGEIGDWRIVLTPVEELLDRNEPELMEFFPGLVLIGGDGGGEAIALDRVTGEVLLVPLIGSHDDWLVLGRHLTEALQRMERGEVFSAPRRVGDVSPST